MCNLSAEKSAQSQCADLLFDLSIILANLGSQVDKGNDNGRCTHDLCSRTNGFPVH
jgi:hypothetical protein